MKIVMVAACPFPCARGTPVRAFRLAEALHECGHEVRVVTYHLGEPAPDPPFPVVRIPAVPFYEDLSPGPDYRKLLVLDPLLAATLGRILARERPDVVHAHHYEGFLAARLAGRGDVPVVFDVHTLLESELPSYPLGLPAFVKRWAGRTLDRLLPARATHVVAVSRTIRRALVERHDLPAERITVVSNGVEDELFGPVDGPPPIARSPSNGGTLVYAGNLAPYQRIDLLLETFRRVRAARPETRLLIVSESSFAPFEELAETLRIREGIHVEPAAFADLPEWLLGADVALNPRIGCDGVPQKLLNYMATGLPIVSFSGHGGYLEDGVTACLVPEGDVEAMARVTVRLLDDTARSRRLGGAARQRAWERFSWLSSARTLEVIYRELAARGRGPGISTDLGTSRRTSGARPRPLVTRPPAPGA